MAGCESFPDDPAGEEQPSKRKSRFFKDPRDNPKPEFQPKPSRLDQAKLFRLPEMPDLFTEDSPDWPDLCRLRDDDRELTVEMLRAHIQVTRHEP